jgi:hypothetical protein
VDGRRLTVDTDNLSCHDAFSRAFLTFADWPQNYYEFLDWAKSRTGKAKQERKFHRRVIRQCDTKSLHFILVAPEGYIEKNECGEDGLGNIFPLVFRRFIDEREACRRLGVGREGLDALIAQGKLDGFHSRHGTGIYVDAESITSFLVKLYDPHPIWVVARALDVNLDDVKGLIR